MPLKIRDKVCLQSTHLIKTPTCLTLENYPAFDWRLSRSELEARFFVYLIQFDSLGSGGRIQGAGLRSLLLFLLLKQ